MTKSTTPRALPEGLLVAADGGRWPAVATSSTSHGSFDRTGVLP